MNLLTMLTIVLAVAIAVERVVEIIKPLYLNIKNVFAKNIYTDCSKTEKIIMTILLGPVMCTIAKIGIDIPSVNEAAAIQYILAGLLASMGSNYLHTLLSIIIAIKNGAEGVNKEMIPISRSK